MKNAARLRPGGDNWEEKAMKSKRAVLVAPRKFEIVDADVTAGPGQVLVKVAVCGLCNWELNHWKGLLGACPQTLGHEWAGEVVALGEGVTRFQPGDRVTGLPPELAGFAEYAVFDEAVCEKVAPAVPIRHALGEPLKCIVTVLQAAQPAFGDYGVVFGCGPMGLWCIQGLTGHSLAGLIAVDIDERKLALAKKHGASHTVNPAKEDAQEKIREITGGRMVDFVIEGTGNEQVVRSAMSCLKSGRGRLLLMSSYASSDAPFDLKLAMEKAVEVRVPHPGFSLDQADDLRRAVAALNKGSFHSEDILSHVFALEEIQRAFETLEHKPADYLKGAVVF